MLGNFLQHYFFHTFRLLLFFGGAGWGDSLYKNCLVESTCSIFFPWRPLHEFFRRFCCEGDFFGKLPDSSQKNNGLSLRQGVLLEFFFN